MLKVPSADVLNDVRPAHLSNESELQRVIEDIVLPRIDLAIVASARAGGGRLGFIDTLAVDRHNIGHIFEYKLNLIDDETIEQVRGYVQWFQHHVEDVSDEAWKHVGRRIVPSPLRVVTVGYRYDPAAITVRLDAELSMWRYEKVDGVLRLFDVDVRRLRNGECDGARLVAEDKEHYLPRHKERTSDAAAAAFDELNDFFDGRFRRKVFGKPRVVFKNASARVQITFAAEALHVLMTFPGRVPEITTVRTVDDARRLLGQINFV